jgi:hypothetical protein
MGKRDIFSRIGREATIHRGNGKAANRARGTAGWRHLARVHRIEHLLPEIGRRDRVDGEGDVVETHLALLFVGVVAGDAVFAEKGPLRFVENGCRRSLLRSGEESGGKQEEEGGSLHRVPAE